MKEALIKSTNTIEIMEQNIFRETRGCLSIAMCNRIANDILNDFEHNGFEIIKSEQLAVKDKMIEILVKKDIQISELMQVYLYDSVKKDLSEMIEVSEGDIRGRSVVYEQQATSELR